MLPTDTAEKDDDKRPLATETALDVDDKVLLDADKTAELEETDELVTGTALDATETWFDALD